MYFSNYIDDKMNYIYTLQTISMYMLEDKADIIVLADVTVPLKKAIRRFFFPIIYIAFWECICIYLHLLVLTELVAFPKTYNQ